MGRGDINFAKLVMVYHGLPYMVKLIRTRCPMILKLGMQHRLQLYKVCINGDLGFTSTDISKRSNLVACAFEAEKRLQGN